MYFVLLSLSVWVSATMSYPFPVVRRSVGYPALRRNDIYGQETFADRSLYGVPATRSAPSLPRSSWPFLNDYVLSRAPQPAAAPVAYGVPGDTIWTDALLRFDEAAGRMSENKPQEVVAQLLRRQEPYVEAARPLTPNVDYGFEDDEEYDGTAADFVPEMAPAEFSPEVLGYGNQFQGSLPEEEASVYDAVRMVPQPMAMQTPDESSAVYRDSILPYLLMSALENEGARVRRPQLSGLPENSQFGEIKTEVQLPSETSTATRSNHSANDHLEGNSDRVPATPTDSLENSKRTKPASQRPSESVAPTQPPMTRVVTEATTSTVQTTPPALPKLNQFQRGQDEVAMLRPPSDNHRFSKGLSALSWPKELEEDDTEEQKRQLRELPMEIGNLKSTDSMAPVAHSPRKWPAALDEVDDWLADQLDQLKTPSEGR